MPIFVLALKPNTYMDIEQLKFTHQKLLDHLESCNYNKVYVKEVKIILAALFDEKSPILSYEDYWERIVNSRRYTKFTLDLKRMYLNTVRAFDEYGEWASLCKITFFIQLQEAQSRLQVFNG